MSEQDLYNLDIFEPFVFFQPINLKCNLNKMPIFVIYFPIKFLSEIKRFFCRKSRFIEIIFIRILQKKKKDRNKNTLNEIKNYYLT